MIEWVEVGGELPSEMTVGKCTPANRNIILDLVRQGAYIAVAAASAGISRQTFYNWLERTEEPFASFIAELETAMASARVVAEVTIHKHDPKYWLTHGPARIRNDPNDPGWAADRVEITGRDGGPIQSVSVQFDPSKLTDDEALALQALFEKTTRGLSEPRPTPPSRRIIDAVQGETAEGIQTGDDEEGPGS